MRGQCLRGGGLRPLRAGPHVDRCDEAADAGEELSVGSISVRAREKQQEGLMMPPMKLIERGKLRADLWRLIMNATRQPAIDRRGADGPGKVQVAGNQALNAPRAAVDKDQLGIKAVLLE